MFELQSEDALIASHGNASDHSEGSCSNALLPPNVQRIPQSAVMHHAEPVVVMHYYNSD